MSALCPLYPPHADIRSALTHVPKGQKQTFLVLENVTLQKASTAPQPGAVNSTCAWPQSEKHHLLPRKDRAQQRSSGDFGHGMSHWRGSNRQVM